VLGTKFNVNNRRGITEVVLTEGKVRLDHNSATYVMEPNEMVRYSPERPLFIPRKVDALEKTSWKEQMLIFDDEPLMDIISRLEDSYGLNITLKNKDLAAETFTGSIPTDSIIVFLDKVEKLYNVRVTRSGDDYIIE
jgi:ferric-dicitrate binding protein FerR (iron transport regulator)